MSVSERTYVVCTNHPKGGGQGSASRVNDLDLPGACNAIAIEYLPGYKYWVLCCDSRDTRANPDFPGRFGFVGMADGPVFLDANIEPDYAWKPEVH